jgi:hypothetical protein
MKAKFVPIFFQSADDPEFIKQMNILHELLADEAEILAPVALGENLPECDGVIFPQMLGEAYRRLDRIKALPQPLMVITSEFGTVSMWDWEINSYLAAKGVSVIAPNSLEKTKKACRTFALKRQLKQSRFLVYQDLPASGGKQDAIFKRFYWWEPECIRAIEDRYGIKVIKKLWSWEIAVNPDPKRPAWGQISLGKITNRAIRAVKICGCGATWTDPSISRELFEQVTVLGHHACWLEFALRRSAHGRGWKRTSCRC